jgi:biofilm PGA synthesis N-glycosyltransferase PgaC
LLIILLVILLTAAGFSPVPLNFLNIILWLGLGGALFTAFFAITLDGAWKDLKYFYVIPLWVPYSLMMDFVMIWAIILEILGKEAQWNKFERTGVITGRDLPDHESK